MHPEPPALYRARRPRRRTGLRPRDGGPHDLGPRRRQPRRPAPQRRRDLSGDAGGDPPGPHDHHVRQLHLRGRRHRRRDGRGPRRALSRRRGSQRPRRRGRLQPHAQTAPEAAAGVGLSPRAVPLAQSVRDQAPEPPQPPTHPRRRRPGGLHRRHRRGREMDGRRPPAGALATDRPARGGPDRAVPPGRLCRELAGQHGPAPGRRRVLPARRQARGPRRPVGEELAGRRRRRGLPALPARHRVGAEIDPSHQSVLRPRRRDHRCDRARRAAGRAGVHHHGGSGHERHGRAAL